MSDQSDYWTDYNRGAAGLPPRNGMFRTWGEQAGYETIFKSFTNTDNGGAGGFIVLIGLVFAVAAIVVIAGVAAVAAVLSLPAAYLLIAVTALFTGHRLGFTQSYKTSFLGLVIAVTIGMAIVLAVMQGVLPNLLSVATVIWLVTEPTDLAQLGLAEWVNALAGTLILIAPGLVAFAFLLRNRIGRPYTGGVGFLRGIAAASFVLFLPMIGFGAAAWFVATYGEIAINSDEITTYLAVSAALVTVMALIGGLLLGLLLMLCGGGLAKGGPMFRTAWFTGAIAMAIAGGTAAIAILFFREGDDMLRTLISWSGAGRLRDAPAFADALPGFLKLVLPGTLAGATYVAGSLYAYRGFFGWIKAFLIAVPASLAGLSGTIMALAQLR